MGKLAEKLAKMPPARRRATLKDLPRHLADASQGKRLTTVLADFEFIECKIFYVSPEALTEDYELALQQLSSHEGENIVSLKLIAQAINLSLSVLWLDKTQISAHLIGRLSSFNLSQIQSLVSQAKNSRSTLWLCPVRPNLMPPTTFLFRTLLGHTGSVNTLAVTKNKLGELILISGSSDGTIKIWELKTGKNLATYIHNAAVQKILVTTDGKELISAHRHGIGGAVGGVTSSFDIATKPGILKISDLDTGKTKFLNEDNPVSFYLMSKTWNDEYIIVQSHQKTFKSLNLKTGEEVLIFRGHSSWQGSDIDTLTVETLADEILSQMAIAGFGVFDLGESPIDGAITAIPKSKNVVSSWGDGSLKVWNVETGEELLSLSGHPGSSVSTLATTRNGRLLISGGSDQLIRIWDLRTGSQIAETKGHQSYVTALALSEDNNIIVSGSSDTNIEIWDLERKKSYTLRGHSARINDLLIIPDKKHIVSASDDATIKIWTFKEIYDDNENKFLPHHSKAITGLDVLPDNQGVVSASADGTVKVWDFNTGQLIDMGNNLWGIANGASVTPDGQWVVSGSGRVGYIMLWNLADKSRRSLIDPDEIFEGHNGRVGQVVVTPDGTRVISASDDRTLQVWDLSSQRRLQTLIGHESYVHNVAVTPDSKKVISASEDQTLIIWNLSDGRLLKQLDGHIEAVSSVTVTPDGKHIISGSQDKMIVIWDIKTGHPLFWFEGHNDEVMDLKVFPDGEKFISVSSDKTIKIWNVHNQKILAQFIGDYPFCRCAVTRDGSKIVAGDAKGYLHFFTLENL